MNIPKASAGNAVAGSARAGSGGAAADFLQQGGGAATTRTGTGRAAAAAGASGDRRQAATENRVGRVENSQQLQQNRSERADQIHKECNDTPVRDFWSDHPVYGAMAITRPFRYADWGMMNNWVGYGAQPTYYNYGENIYYQDGAVYNGDQQIASEEQYAQQAEDLAQTAPDTPAKDMEWMSLGVFALTEDGESSGAAPTLFMQLALSKEGVISGILENKTTGETQTLEGMADKTSQRAAWGVVDKQRPIMETGISNLTQDSAPALIHFADGQTQQWLLVRLEEPAKP